MIVADFRNSRNSGLCQEGAEHPEKVTSLTKWVPLFPMCSERRVQTADAFRFSGSLLPLLIVSEDVAGGDVIRSLRRMSALEAASSDSALPVEESLWTLTRQRQWPLSFRAFVRNADKSLRDFLKGRPRSLSARSL